MIGFPGYFPVKCTDNVRTRGGRATVKIGETRRAGNRKAIRWE